ncbi:MULTISPECIES: glycosyltransferase family 2 protein [Clostridium]|uniref:glycosyltransferase family 2 protein n=1 Tax=Clostridium TaxID=1485 RepID=UPI0008271C50|nr:MULTISPECIES: glycosyltransferase [Clostridium]
MNKEIVSIIVLTYNNLKYLDECLSSIFMQNYDSMELIISDDCSKQFNYKYIKDYIDNKKSVNIVNYKIIHNTKNLGTVKNFNNAIKNSNGKYIIPLAIDDCFYNENVIKSIVEFFTNNDILILSGYRIMYNKAINAKVKILPTKKQIEMLRGDNDKLYRILCKQNFISGSSTAYSRKFFDKYGLFDEAYILLEDYPKYMQILRKGEKIGFIDLPIIKYRVGGISTVHKTNSILQNDFNLVISKEILPYKKIIGTTIYRLKKFEYMKLTKECNIFFLGILYPDIVFYKILKKLKLIDRDIYEC